MSESLYQLLFSLLWLSFAALVFHLILQSRNREQSRKQEINLEKIRNEHEIKRWENDKKTHRLNELKMMNKIEKLKTES